MVFSVKTHCGLFCVSLVSSLLFLSLCSSSVSIRDCFITILSFISSHCHHIVSDNAGHIPLASWTAEDNGPQVYKGPLGGDWSTWGTCLPIFCDYADCQQVTRLQCTNYYFSLIGTTCSWYSSSLRVPKHWGSYFCIHVFLFSLPSFCHFSSDTTKTLVMFTSWFGVK